MRSELAIVIFGSLVLLAVVLFNFGGIDLFLNNNSNTLLSFVQADDLVEKNVIDNNYLILIDEPFVNDENPEGVPQCYDKDEFILLCDPNAPNVYTVNEINQLAVQNQESVQIRSMIQIRDDLGAITVDVVDTNLGNFLSFVEASDRVNRPIENGRIDYWLRLDFSSPKSDVNAEGTLIFVTPKQTKEYTFSGEGFTNDNELTIRINTLSGTIRNDIKDLGLPFGTSEIKVILKDIVIDADGDKFTLDTETLLYKASFNKNESHSIIQNESGEFVKVWATDNNLIIRANHGTTSAVYWQHQQWVGFSIPMMGAELRNMKVYDKDGVLIASSSQHIASCNRVANSAYSGCITTSFIGTPIEVKLQRNSTYKVSFDTYLIGKFQNHYDFTINTPKTQKDYVFSCAYNLSYNQKSNTNYSGLDCNFPNL